MSKHGYKTEEDNRQQQQLLSHMSEHSYLTEEANLNCNDNNDQVKEKKSDNKNNKNCFQTGQDLLQYHISCFRCSVCFKILKARDENITSSDIIDTDHPFYVFFRMG